MPRVDQADAQIFRSLRVVMLDISGNVGVRALPDRVVDVFPARAGAYGERADLPVGVALDLQSFVTAGRVDV